MNVKIKKMYSCLPLPLKSVFWFTACQVLQRGIGLMTSPLIARLLSYEEYGRASAFYSCEDIFMMLVTLSSGKAIMNLCVKYQDRKKVLSSIMGYNVLISALWGMLFILGSEMISKMVGLSRGLIACLYIYCLFMNIIGCWASIKRYDYSYKEVVVESLLYTMGSSIGSLLMVTFVSRTAEAKVIPQVAFAFAIGLTILICVFKSGRGFFDRDVWKYTFSFCVPLLPHYLSEIVLMSSDRIMINKMCGASDVAIYSIAYTVGSLITVITTAINQAFAPYQYRKITNRQYKILAKNTNVIITFIAFCLVGIMLFGREVVLIFGGKKYIDSVPLLIPISLGSFFNYVFQLFARVQEYFEQKNTIVIASVSCAILNVVLNYVLIRAFGYQAAAYTTFFCYFAFCFLHYLFYRIACKRNIGHEIYDSKGIALISIALIIAAIAANFLSKFYVLKYIILLTVIVSVIWKRKKILRFINSIREGQQKTE